MLSGCASSLPYAQREFEIFFTESVAVRRGVFTIPLDRWTDDAPTGALLHIDLDEPHAVSAEYRGQKEDLGILQYQFPNTPVKTIVIDTGADRLLVGWIDYTIDGFLDTIRIGRRDDGSVGSLGRSYRTNPKTRTFTLPIYDEQLSSWADITSITISTLESLESRYAEPPLKDVSWVLRKEYNPPIDWLSWSVPVKFDVQ